MSIVKLNSWEKAILGLRTNVSRQDDRADKIKRTNKLTGADEKEKRQGWVLLSWLAKFESLPFLWQKRDL